MNQTQSESLPHFKISEDLHTFYKTLCSKYHLTIVEIIDLLLRNKMNEIKHSNFDFNPERLLHKKEQIITYQVEKIQDLENEVVSLKQKLQKLLKQKV